MEHHDSIWVVFCKVVMAWAGAIGAAVGAVTLNQWALIVAIIGGILAGFYTILQMYVLWRDKILSGPGRAGKMTRSTDTAAGELQ